MVVYVGTSFLLVSNSLLNGQTTLLNLQLIGMGIVFRVAVVNNTVRTFVCNFLWGPLYQVLLCKYLERNSGSHENSV